MQKKREIKSLIAPLISIVAFLILIVGSSYAYFSQSIGGIGNAANIANVNATVPRGCTFLATATNCILTSNAGTTTAFTDAYISTAEMSQAYAGNSVAQASCALNIGVQGAAGCKCGYTVSLSGQSTTNYTADSLKVTAAKGGTTQTLLPSAYQQVDYITFQGAQYIDTGFAFNPTTDGISVVFQPNTTSQDSMVFAMGTRSNPLIWLYNAGSILYYYTSAGNSSNLGKDTQKHIAYYNQKKGYFDGNLVLNATGSFSTASPYPNMFIGALINGTEKGWYFKGNIHIVILYRNNAVERIYVPCYRKSDSVIGMYELKSGVFYTNAGSGSFAKGSNVTEFDVSMPFNSTGTISVASTGTAVYNQYNLTLKAYNVDLAQNNLAGNGYVYKLKATPVCTVGAESHTVTYDANGGSVSPTTGTASLADTYGSMPTPTYSGHSFSGWFVNQVHDFTLAASSTSNYNYYVIAYVRPGTKYTIRIGSAKVTSGSATQFTTLVYDATSAASLGSYLTAFGDNLSYEVSVPATADPTHSLRILIYSGQAGSTMNIATAYNNVDISTNDGYAMNGNSIVSTGYDHTLYAKWN